MGDPPCLGRLQRSSSREMNKSDEPGRRVRGSPSSHAERSEMSSQFVGEQSQLVQFWASVTCCTFAESSGFTEQVIHTWKAKYLSRLLEFDALAKCQFRAPKGGASPFPSG